MINEILHTFVAVVKLGSFNRATEHLSLSAPAIMKQMNSLEKSVGVSLFHRSNRGITLTPAGESFYKDALTILRHTRKAMENAQTAAGLVPDVTKRCGAGRHRKEQEEGGIKMEHPKFPIPEDEEGRKRYESAKKHAAWAKEQGKSTEEIHEIFKKVMSGTGEGKCQKKNK